MHLSEKNVSNSKLEIWLESRLTGRWLSPKNAPLSGKIHFLWLAQSGLKPPFFEISRLVNKKLNVKRKVNCGELHAKKSVRIGPHSESRPRNLSKSTGKSETTLACALPRTRIPLRDGRNAKRKLSALQWKDRLRDLCNYLNQKVKTAINALNGSMMGDNVITSHQVGRLCALSAHSNWSCWK